jgi:hypothetical protein
VLEYLSKKGYVRTEAMLRKESEQPQGTNGGPLVPKEVDAGAEKYRKAFGEFIFVARSHVQIGIHQPKTCIWN